MFSRLLFAGFLVIMIWLGLLSNSASSQQVESRINNLEANFNRFESRLSRVEAQLNQTRPSPSPGISNIPSSSNPKRNLSQQERERMFDRLATLVVELKQQVNKLETRISQLESR
jgi:predicted component of type VI protein secretion system